MKWSPYKCNSIFHKIYRTHLCWKFPITTIIKLINIWFPCLFCNICFIYGSLRFSNEKILRLIGHLLAYKHICYYILSVTIISLLIIQWLLIYVTWLRWVNFNKYFIYTMIWTNSVVKFINRYLNLRL